jgi:acetoacetate decarboxylase
MGITFDRQNAYIMPAHFGPWRIGNKDNDTTGHYSSVTQMTVSYTTDKDELARLLPTPLEPADDPVVSYTLQVCRGCDFLAGRGYNVIAVNLAAVFNGTSDHVAGAYAAFLWETDTFPIILGREMLGAPKMYGQIPDPSHDKGAWTFYCSEYGNRLLNAEVKKLKPVGDDVCKQMSAMGAARNWICWRYLPKPGGKDAEVSYATVVKSNPTINKAWLGEGTIELFDVSFEQAPISSHVVRALRRLPVREFKPAIMSEGSSDLLTGETRKIE